MLEIHLPNAGFCTNHSAVDTDRDEHSKHIVKQPAGHGLVRLDPGPRAGAGPTNPTLPAVTPLVAGLLVGFWWGQWDVVAEAVDTKPA